MASNLRTFVIANPTSGAGSVEREWDVLERHLKSTLNEYDVAFTHGPGHATLLAREALRAGWEMIVAIGGDGTLNETINGFFEKPDPRALYQMQSNGWMTWKGEDPEMINPEAVLGVVPLGTGGDFRRTIGLMGGWKEAVNALKGDNHRVIDVCQAGFINHEGHIDTRYYLNIASGGIAGEVDALVNKMSKRLGGTASFALASARAFATWHNAELEMRLDEVEEIQERTLMFIAANGQFFGGGMWIAPGASLTDGQLEIVQLGDLGKREAIPTFAKFYSGTHLSSDKVWRRQARQISVRCTNRGRDVLLDIDGEQPGRLPAIFHVHAGKLRFKT